MRTLGIACGVLICLSCTVVAEEAIAVAEQPMTASTEDVVEAPYPLKWQNRLLAAQLAFAATLQQTDPIETGAITPQVQ